MGALLGGLIGAGAAVFLFAWTQFWDIHSKLRKELRNDLGLAQGVIWGSRYAPALARLFLDLQKEDDPVNDPQRHEEYIQRLANRMRSEDFPDRIEEVCNIDQSGSTIQSLALAQLFFDLRKVGDPLNGAEEDEDAHIERLAARITRKGFFERVEEAYNLGQAASTLQSLYERLADDGTRAFVASFVFAVLLPTSVAFALVPGADDQEAYWVAGVTSWSVLVALVFCAATFWAGRFWRRKASLNRMLDEYES